MRKSTWTAEQDRDGIMILIAGSNTCYINFNSQEEAEAFNRDELGGKGRIKRNGRYADKTDDEVQQDYDLRRLRINAGLSVWPMIFDDEAGTTEIRKPE